MRAPTACNLVATLSYPPWKKSLHRDVYMTIDGEKRIPFYAYVQPSTTSIHTGKHSSTEFPFDKLAAELQLCVLDFCSTSTLFQLMHVARTIRIEASKLFWAKPDAYFLIEAQWLLEGAYPGYTYWNKDFFANVRNIEVEYAPSLRCRICPQYDGNLYIRHDLIEVFWNSLKKRFPRIKTVVLNHNQESSCWEVDNEPLPLPLRLLLQACPRDINASALFIEKKQKASVDASTMNVPLSKWERSVYRLTAGKIWEKSKWDRHRKTILMPPKQFNGPVGEFRKLRYEFHQRIFLQEWGLWPLIVEALDRHHFDGRNEPFTCPLPECDVYFKKAGAWTVHAAEMHFQERIRLLDSLPNNMRAQFVERSHTLNKKKKEINKHIGILRDAWNERNGVKQREMERDWVEQLEDDEAWATGKSAKESELWEEFVGWMAPESGWGS